MKRNQPDHREDRHSIIRRGEKKMLYSHIVFYIVFTSVAYYFTAVYNKHLLIKLDELSIFLPTKLYFTDSLSIPGGLLPYLGAFLTQFFYYPVIGSTLFIILLLTVQYLTYKAFKIPLKHYLLSFIPATAMLLLVTELDYVIYELIDNGFAYINILGILFTYGSFLIYNKIKSKGWKYLFSSIFILAFYPLVGFYALMAAMLVLISEIVAFFKEGRDTSRFIPIFIIAAGIIFIPLFYYYKVYQISFKSIYTVGLPKFALVKNEVLYWLPFLILFISTLLLSLSPVFNNLVIKPDIAVNLSFVVNLVVLLTVSIFSNKDDNFHSELAIDHALFNNKWNKVLKINKNIKDEPTRLIVMTTRLALQKLNKAGDLMFTYKDGNKKQQSRRKLSLWHYASQPLFYHYGMVNDCYRWCMEDLARFGPKVQYLRYMIKCSILNNELALAEKYNATLMKTMFYKKWAKKYQKYIDHPELVNNDPEFKSNLLLYSFPDDLYSDKGKFEEYLAIRFMSISGGRMELLELSMQYSLMMRNDKKFWPLFFFYINNHDRIPVHYQEAALAFRNVNKQVDLSKVKFDESVIKNYKEAHSSKIPKNNLQSYYKEHFGNTYWYYLYFGEIQNN